MADGGPQARLRISEVAVQISVGNAKLTANRDVKQLVEVLPSPSDRDSALITHINQLPMGSRVLIFCSTKKSCDALSRAMARQVGCSSIHGDKEQFEREATLRDFRSGVAPSRGNRRSCARADIKDIASPLTTLPLASRTTSTALDNG